MEWLDIGSTSSQPEGVGLSLNSLSMTIGRGDWQCWRLHGTAKPSQRWLLGTFQKFCGHTRPSSSRQHRIRGKLNSRKLWADGAGCLLLLRGHVGMDSWRRQLWMCWWAVDEKHERREPVPVLELSLSVLLVHVKESDLPLASTLLWTRRLD